MAAPPTPARPSWPMAFFWWLLPIVVLCLLWAIVNTRLSNDELAINLHPNAVAVVLGANGVNGLGALAATPPISYLGYHPFWRVAFSSAKQTHSLLGGGASIATLVTLPNGGYASINGATYPTQQDALLSWHKLLSTLGRSQYNLTAISQDTLAIPTVPALQKQVLAVLLQGKTIWLHTEPELLQDIAHIPRSIRVAQLPPKKAFGLILFLDAISLSDTTGASLPFYPILRASSLARVATLLPNAKGAFIGETSGSDDGLKWPTPNKLPLSAEASTQTGWAVRIGQGLAGSTLLRGRQDSLTSLREMLAGKLTGIRCGFVQSSTQTIPYTDIFGTDMTAFAQQLSAHMHATKDTIQANAAWPLHPILASKADLQANLLGLPTSHARGTYCQLRGNNIRFSTTLDAFNVDPKPDTTFRNDLALHLSMAHLWSYFARNGPAALATLQTAYPLTAARLDALDVRVVGNLFHVTLSAMEPSALAPMPCQANKPFFTSLFPEPATPIPTTTQQLNAELFVATPTTLFGFVPGARAHFRTHLAAMPQHIEAVSNRYMLRYPDKIVGLDSSGKTLFTYPASPSILHISTANGTWLLTQTPKEQKLELFDISGRLKARYTLRLSKRFDGATSTPDGGFALWAGSQTKTKRLYLALINGQGKQIGTATIASPDSGTFAWAFTSQPDGLPAIISVSDKGFATISTLYGKVLKRKQLYMPDVSATFSLVTGKYGSVIYRSSTAGLAAYAEDLTKALDVPMPGARGVDYLATSARDVFYAIQKQDSLLVLNRIGLRVYAQKRAAEQTATLAKTTEGRPAVGITQGRQIFWTHLTTSANERVE